MAPSFFKVTKPSEVLCSRTFSGETTASTALKQFQCVIWLWFRKVRSFCKCTKLTYVLQRTTSSNHATVKRKAATLPSMGFDASSCADYRLALKSAQEEGICFV
ncbi:hypothetical protein M514_09108 [Trichuris suis]|uniref:Uncharacterized protein n=1 Tax=Trichuris suis TaxID=68888 RepID=A0A085LYG9_9BILA|nr:hypothetical protein M513_09108 [Trichuris suis]KFD64747.1 hypothetical protein M514_09108 [Trichuris suis]